MKNNIYSLSEARQRVAENLKAQGYGLPKEWKLKDRGDGKLEVGDHDYSGSRAHPSGGIPTLVFNWHNIPFKKLVEELTRHAFKALRCQQTVGEQRQAEEDGRDPASWSVLAHPLIVAMGVHVGFPRQKIPPTRKSPLDRTYPVYNQDLLFEKSITWDMMAATIATSFDVGSSHVNVRIESDKNRTHIRIEISIPETLKTMLIGKPLSKLIGFPKVKDETLNAAVERLTIQSINEFQNGVDMYGMPQFYLSVNIAPTTWVPWGHPPEEVAKLIKLSPEIR